MQEDPSIVEWIRARIKVTRFDPVLWNDAHSAIVLIFVADPSIKTLFATVDQSSNSLILSCGSPPKPSPDRLDVAYFIRGQGHVINLVNIDEVLVFGTVLMDQTATSVLSTMENVSYPIIFSCDMLTESFKIELLGLYHRFMAALTETSNDEGNKSTSLYIPAQKFQKDMSEKVVVEEEMKQLESIVIHWTREIKSVLNNHVNSIRPGQLSGLTEELSFWKSRANDLSNISLQLSIEKVRDILCILKAVKSKYADACSDLFLAVEKGSDEAENCVKFLEILREPCHKLLTLDVDEISRLFPRFLNCVRAIFTLSLSYNTYDRISGLLRRISGEIIRHSSSQISLDEIFHGDVYKVSKLLKECIECGIQWKNLYNRTAATVNKSSGKMLWKLSDDTIFAELNAFIQRCHDLIELCDGRIQFTFLLGDLKDKVAVGGANGSNVEKILQQISASFSTQIYRLSALNYNIIDATTFQWYDDFNTFKLVVKDLDERFINTINAAFKPIKEIKIAAKIFQSFRKIVHRRVVNICLDKKASDICELFKKECEQVRNEFDDHHRNPPLRKDEPPFAGPALWAQALCKDIEDKWHVLEVVAQGDSSGLLSDAKEKKEGLLEALQGYQRQKYESWMAITSNAMNTIELRYRLDQPLLRRFDSVEIHENQRYFIDSKFDSELNDIFVETQFWERLHIEECITPNAVLAMCNQRETLRILQERVAMLVRAFNNLIGDLSKTHKLYTDHLKLLDKKMHAGFDRLLWSSRPALIEKYVQTSLNHIKAVHCEVTSFKCGMEIVETNCNILSKISLIEVDKKNREYFNFEFASQQADHRKKSKRIMMESYAQIRSAVSALFNQFADKSEDVQINWQQHIKCIDSSILAALRECVLTSLDYLMRAMGYENNNVSGDAQCLVSTCVILKNGQVQSIPSMIDVIQSMNTIIKETIASISSFQQLTESLSSESYFYEEISSDSLVLEKVVKIMNNTAANAIEVKKKMLEWDQYKHLWEMDKDSFIRRYKKTNQSPNSFEKDLFLLQERSKKIAAISSKLAVQFIYLDFTSLKSVLLVHSDEFKQKLLNLLIFNTSHKLKLIDAMTDVDINMKMLNRPLTTVIEVMETMEFVEALKQKWENIDLNPLVTAQKILINFGEKDMDFEKRERLLQHLKPRLSTLRSFISEVEEKANMYSKKNGDELLWESLMCFHHL